MRNGATFRWPPVPESRRDLALAETKSNRISTPTASKADAELTLEGTLISLVRTHAKRARCERGSCRSRVIQHVIRVDSDLDAHGFGGAEGLAGTHVQIPVSDGLEVSETQRAKLSRVGIFEQHFARRPICIAFRHGL